MKELLRIANSSVLLDGGTETPTILFTADADIDCDGTHLGRPFNPDRDPYYQAATTLKVPCALDHPNRFSVAARSVARAWWPKARFPEGNLPVPWRYLDAYEEPYIVLPPAVIAAVRPIVLGSHAKVTYHRTGRSVWAVVGDVEPSRKIGELSVAAARALGMPANPVTGGESDDTQVEYRIWPGQPAMVQGVVYELQRSAA